MTQHLFSIEGHWIAFRGSEKDKYLFDKTGRWIGWFPWGDNDAVGTRGSYLGTVFGDRFVYFVSRPYRGYPGFPGHPSLSGYSGDPQPDRHRLYIPGAEEVKAFGYGSVAA